VENLPQVAEARLGEVIVKPEGDAQLQPLIVSVTENSLPSNHR